MSRYLAVEIRVVDEEKKPIEGFRVHTEYESLPDDWDDDTLKEKVINFSIHVFGEFEWYSCEWAEESEEQNHAES